MSHIQPNTTTPDSLGEPAKPRVYIRSEEARANMSRAQRGRRLTPEHRAKISKGLTGLSPGKETRAKMSAAKKGRKRPVSRQVLEMTEQWHRENSA
jgi:NUMOD3 motif